MRWCVVLFAVVSTATPAVAQSTYVGASLVGDVARFSGVDYDDDDDVARILGNPSHDGEALGFNVKIGRSITDRWGLEFEYARSGEFEGSFPQILPAATTMPRVVPASWIDAVIFPYERFSVESERHHSSLSALAFVRQDLGDRVELSFLGGIAFNRIETEHDFDIGFPRPTIYPPIVQDVESTEYHVGPAVGLEAAWKFSDSAAITGGMRLHGVTVTGLGGWLLRPNVGLRWRF